MEEQVVQFIPHLKAGSNYLFDHTRKGPFVAEFIGTRPAKDDDPQDTLFIEVNIITEDGSGQERLANTFMRDGLGRKMRPPFESRLIRPSLLRSITSPSSEAQRQLTEKFLAMRAEASNRGTPDGEAVLPFLSLPTEKAMAHLSNSEETSAKKTGFFKKLFGGGN